MKNKKLLNTVLLSFALVLFVGLILEFCGVIGTTVIATTATKIFYYVFNILNMLALVAIIVLGIFNLFKDNYSSIKLCEFVATISFLLSFLTVICFATELTAIISYGYVIIAVLSFAMAMFSQVFRLCSIFKTFKTDVESTFGIKLEKKEVKVPELKKGNKKPEAEKEEKIEVVDAEIVNK